MSSNFTDFNVSSYDGTPYAQPIGLCLKSTQPPATVKFPIMWTDYGASVGNNQIGVRIDLLGQQTAAPLDILRSVYIDNTKSGVTVYCQCADTGFTVPCPPGSAVMSPLFTRLQNIFFFAEGFATGDNPLTTFYLSNVDREGYYIPTAVTTSISPVAVVNTQNSGGNATVSFAINNAPISAAQTDRLVIFCVEFTTPGVTITGVDIGGFPTTLVASSTTTTGTVCRSQIYRASVPTGTTATINITLGGGAGQMNIAWEIYAVYNLTSHTPIYSNGFIGPESVSPKGFTVPVRANGICFMNAVTTASPSYSGSAVDYNRFITGPDYYGNGGSALTNQTGSNTMTSQTARAISVASFS